MRILRYILDCLEQIWTLMGRELKMILTSFSIMMVIVAGNIVYAFFYPSPYLNDVLSAQKIALVDEDRTQKSRELAFNANAQMRIEIIKDTSMQEAKEMLVRGEVFGILHIPKDFEKNGIKASAPKVYYIANNAYFLIYSSILEGLNNATSALDFKAQQNLYLHGAVREMPIIQGEFIALFNPSVGYLNYILGAVLVFILHQTIMIACGILCGTQIQQYNLKKLNRESRESSGDSSKDSRESNGDSRIDSRKDSRDSSQNLPQDSRLDSRATIRENKIRTNKIRANLKNFLDDDKPSDNLYFADISNPLLLIFARISVFIVIYFPLFLFYFGFIYSFYNLTTFAQSLHLLAFGLCFIIATSAFSIFFGFCFNRREYAPQIILVMSVPLLFGLGVIWPSQSVPFLVRIFMDFIPITPSVSGFLKLNQMGADFSDIWGEFLHLFLLALLYSFGAYLIIQKRFKILKDEK